MDIERVELLTTLKTDKVWKKGTIFDPKKDGRPIPPAIIAEVRAKNWKTVRVLGPKKDIEKKALITEEVPMTLAELKERYPGLVAELSVKIKAAFEADLRTMQDLHAEATDLSWKPLTGGDILRMTQDQILDLLKNEKDFETLKTEKRTVLVGIARKRFVKNDQS